MALEVRGSTPKEALAFWKSKTPLPKAELERLSELAKDRAFAVAGIARRSQISQIHAALNTALEKGETLQSFKKRIASVISAKGWTGEKAWRVENIYRTNMQSAYMAGRYTQMQATVNTRPYWRYIAVKDRRTRPSHAALNGKVFPADDGFWDVYYPPNGFRCRCTVQTLSNRQVEKRGYEVETDIPALITPDPGFTGNVGKNWLNGLSPAEWEGAIKYLAGQPICRQGQGVFSSGNVCVPPLKSIDKRHILPVKASEVLAKGLAAEDYVRAFLAEFGLQGVNDSMVHTLPGNIAVVIDNRLFVDKRTGKWKVKKNGRERYVRLLARTVLNPLEIWQVPAQIAGRPHDVLRLIRLFRDPDGQEIGGFGVFNLSSNNLWTGATVFTPGSHIRNRAAREASMLKYLENQRAGTLIYREP